MKQLLLTLMSGIFFVACNNPASSSKEPASDSTAVATAPAAQKMDYPYKINKPDNWDMGSQQNTLIALRALKAWENNKIDESAGYFSDSVQVRFDGLDKKVSNDTLKALITYRPDVKSYTIRMEDWESVISKDKKDEYVTLWYRQFIEYKNGKKDSVDVINDLKMKDGKIIGLDEYSRKLH